MTTRPARVWLTGLCVCLLASATGRAQQGPPRAQVAPVIERDGVEAGASARVALSVLLPDGFHANSNRPRDPLLIPMVVSVRPPAGVIVDELVFPPATDLKQIGSEQPLAVFERTFAIGASLTIAPTVPLGTLVVPVTLRYQACDETMCYLPATAETSWTLTVVAPGTPSKIVGGPLFDKIAFGTGEAPAVESAVPVSRPAAASAAPQDALGLLDRFSIAGTTAGYLNADDFLGFVGNAEAGIKERGWFEDKGPLAVLFIVLIGGLALNLTPCVLPLVPVNLAIIGAGAQAGSRSRGFFLGAAYGSAMALVYGVLGLIVVLTASTFGTINASPWFNVGIAILFVVLALAMFDVLVIDFSRLSSRFQVREGGRGSFVVAFGMGAVAAMLAGACVAPVVIQVVLFASHMYASGTSMALALPFLLGLGMALPWPIAGAGMAALPKPGAWMVRVKQVIGIFILGTAVYYAYLAYGLFDSRRVNAADVQASVAEKLKEGWHADLVEGLTIASAERKPVLVDLWATWCKNCLVMDRTTLVDPAVRSALDGYVRIKFQAEDPEEPLVRDVMRHFGAVGLPTYVVLKPR